MRRWWCRKRGHPGADVLVDHRDFIVIDCHSCHTVVFHALADDVFTKAQPISFYEDLLAEYGYEATE